MPTTNMGNALPYLVVSLIFPEVNNVDVKWLTSVALGKRHLSSDSRTNITRKSNITVVLLFFL